MGEKERDLNAIVLTVDDELKGKTAIITTDRCPICKYTYRKIRYVPKAKDEKKIEKCLMGEKPFKELYVQGVSYAYGLDQFLRAIGCPNCGVLLDPEICRCKEEVELPK